MVGGEESVPTVQHARLAARPAGWRHRPPCTNTAASARHREPGVADFSSSTDIQTRIPLLILPPEQV